MPDVVMQTHNDLLPRSFVGRCAATIGCGLAMVLLGWSVTAIGRDGDPVAGDSLLLAVGAPALVVLLLGWALLAHYRAVLARSALNACEQRHRSLLDSADAGMALIDREGRLAEWNDRLPAVLGAIDTTAVGRAIAAYPWQELALSIANQARSQPDNTSLDTRIVGCDGAQRWIRLRSWPAAGGAEGDRWLEVLDITNREEMHLLLRLAQQAYRSMSEAILITDATTRIVEINPAFEHLTGFRREEVIGMRPSLLRSEKQPPEFFQVMWQRLSAENHWAGEIWNRRADGTVIPCWMHIDGVRNPASGEVTHYVGVFSSIAERKLLEERMSYLAHHDPLTGLANRLSLDAILPQSLAIARRHGRRVALLFIDLDRFKEINDRLGHASGDAVLREVANRLTGTIRDCDFVARIGGDEFLIVLNEVADASEAMRVADAVMKSFESSLAVEDDSLQVTSSIGISLFPEDGEDPALLIGRADLAMYRAKAAGRAGVKFHGEQTLH